MNVVDATALQNAESQIKTLTDRLETARMTEAQLRADRATPCITERERAAAHLDDLFSGDLRVAVTALVDCLRE